MLSTFALAALFNPLRRYRRAQIDRRFYRRKFYAQHVLAAFSASVRDEVDLDQLSEHLTGVVGETLQPTQVSLWVKPRSHEGRR